MSSTRKKSLPAALLFFGVISAITIIWSGPFLWMIVASFKPQTFGGLDMASVIPNF